MASRASGLPSILDTEAWGAPAEAVAVAAAVGEVLAFVEPTATDGRAAMVTRAISQRGYSAPEIELIKREAPFANHYGPHVRLDVIDKIVNDHRAVRAMLARPLSGDDVAAVCTLDPALSPDDFACTGFDSRNNPLWRYAPAVAASARDRGIVATPEMPDAVGRQEGPVTLHLIPGNGAQDAAA